MNCPKCNVKMVKGCCLKCGYMENGNVIREHEPIDNHVNEHLFNKDFDKMYRNENSLLPLFLGGLYVSYRGYLIIGIIINVLELVCFNILIRTLNGIYILMAFTPIIFLLTFIFERLILGAIENSLCLYLDNLKIKYIIKRKKDNYKKYLLRHKNRHILYIIINLVFCIYFYSTFLSY